MLLLFLGSSYAQKHPAKEKTGVTAKYDYAGPFCNGLARVKLNKKWGYIDTTGNVVVSPKYNQAENFSDGMARVRLGQKWGLINTSGTEIIKPTFDFIDVFIDGKAKVLLNGMEYYMNTDGIRVDNAYTPPTEKKVK